MHVLPRLLVLALASAAIAFSQDQDPDAIFQETLFSPPFPALAPAPQRPVNGPWNADVIVYRTTAEGQVTRTATFERAGVPTIARLEDGRLIAAHQHFPENDAANFDKVAVHFSSDEGRTWTAATVIRLQGLPAGMRFPFDPTLVTLPDGRLRLYFTSRRFEESHPAIHSAISSDGIDYIYEPGVRFAIADRPVIDCAVVLHQNTFHLFSPDNGTEIHHGQGNATSDNVGYHAVSTDGLTFTRVADVHIEGRGRRWLGNAHSDGRLITFCGTGMPLAQPNQKPDGNVWMATSTDAQTWRIIPSPSIYGGDPGAIPNPDGTLTIVITGEPRNREPRNR